MAHTTQRVLLVERGPWLATGDLRQDHLRNHRVGLGYDYPAGPPTAGSPRVFASAAGDTVVPPTDPRWHNNAMTAGGGYARLWRAELALLPRRLSDGQHLRRSRG